MTDKVKNSPHEVAFEDIAKLDYTLNSARVANGRIWLVGQYSGALLQLIRFMNLVVYGKKLAYAIRMVDGRKKAVPVSKLAHYFDLVHGFLELYSIDLAYAPQIQLFFDCYQKHRIRDGILDRLNRITVGDEIEAEMFNDFIEYMRKQGNCIDVKRKVADWERNSKKNLKRLHSYVNALFDYKRARLLVLRIDFLYKRACLSEEEAYQMNGKLQELGTLDQMAYLNGKEDTRERETVARIDIREVMKDRDHLFENMREKPTLFRYLVGHVWSIEYSRAGGYHMHCAFFFDGAEKRKHEWLADQIGLYWETVITKGRGLYHNCNRGTYDEYVLGPTGYEENEKRKRLLHHLGYLAKKDQYVYVKPSVKCKLFGTGRMPKVRTNGPGRPRKK